MRVVMPYWQFESDTFAMYCRINFVGSMTISYPVGSHDVRKELRICCHTNIEIKGGHARVVTSGVSGHLPISDDRLHNIFVNAFARVPTNSIIATRHNMPRTYDCITHEVRISKSKIHELSCL